MIEIDFNSPAIAPVKLTLEALHQSAGAAAQLLKSMANEDRLLLLCQLTQGELCVSELEKRLAIRQPSLSQQLGVLRNDGLVTTRRDGKHIFYQLADPRVTALLGTLYQLFCNSEESTL